MIRRLAALALAALSLTFAAPAAADPAEPMQAKPARKKAVILEAFNKIRPTDTDQFSGIAPCVKVLKTTWEQAQGGAQHVVNFNYRYKSGGKNAKGKIQVLLRSMNLLGEDPVLTNYVRVDTTVDVVSKPVDAASTIKGKARFKRVGTKKKR